MQQRRVIILHDGKLLSEGVVLLIQAQTNLEAVVVDSRDPDVLAKVRESQPDVIVVPSYNGASHLTRVAQILRDNPGTKVISFGLEKPEMNAYRAEAVAAASLESLLAAIEGEN